MPEPLIYIVEDDESVRQGLARLVDAACLESRPCASVEAFLGETPAARAACAVLDISGLRGCPAEVWSRLRAVATLLPVIALSTGDDPATRRMARDLGARALFRLPVDAGALLDSIDWVSRSDGTPAAG
jgi:FixJ family two-component response regulator